MHELLAAHERVTRAGEVPVRLIVQYSQLLTLVRPLPSVPAVGAPLKNSARNVLFVGACGMTPIARKPPSTFPTGKVNGAVVVVILANGPLTKAPFIVDAPPSIPTVIKLVAVVVT